MDGALFGSAYVAVKPCILVFESLTWLTDARSDRNVLMQWQRDFFHDLAIDAVHSDNSQCCLERKKKSCASDFVHPPFAVYVFMSVVFHVMFLFPNL